jgi:hypothetical protein
MLLASYTAASVSDLIKDIKHGGLNTITLVANTTFDLTVVNNKNDGPTGLPVIASNCNVTIDGNGDTIERSTAAGTPDFRLFDVAGGGSLTLNSLTLQNGLAFGSGSAAEGGAVFNQGTLVLNGVTVQNNSAQGSPGAPGQPPAGKHANGNGSPGADASGGAIWSSESLTCASGTLIQNNSATGGSGGNIDFVNGSGTGGAGGGAYGGGLCIAGGTAFLAGAQLSGNVAQGGQGGTNGFANGSINPGSGGSAYGGGVEVSGGTVTLSNDTITGNQALGGDVGAGIYSNGPFPNQRNAYGGGVEVSGGSVTLSTDTIDGNGVFGGFWADEGIVGQGFGGGIYIASAATVWIDTFTMTNTANNNPDNIAYGTYILQN